MIDHTKALHDIDETMISLSDQLIRIGDRQVTMIRVGVAAIVVFLVAIVAVVVVLLGNRATVKAQTDLLCPSVGILASTEPPRTTPAGREQAEAARRLVDGPAFEACR